MVATYKSQEAVSCSTGRTMDTGFPISRFPSHSEFPCAPSPPPTGNPESQLLSFHEVSTKKTTETTGSTGPLQGRKSGPKDSAPTPTPIDLEKPPNHC